MLQRICQGTTKRGNKCNAFAINDSEYCIAHSPKEVQEKAGFGGSQPGSGRPRTPRAIDVLKDRIERDIDKVLAPYDEVLNSTDPTLIHLKVQVAEKLLDRVYGKSAQIVKHSGDSEEPIDVNVNLSQKAREALSDALRGRPATRAE